PRVRVPDSLHQVLAGLRAVGSSQRLDRVGTYRRIRIFEPPTRFLRRPAASLAVGAHLPVAFDARRIGGPLSMSDAAEHDDRKGDHSRALPLPSVHRTGSLS